MISERRRSTCIILPVIARPLVTTLAAGPFLVAGPVIARPVLAGMFLARRLCGTFLSRFVLRLAFLTGPVVAWPVLARTLLAGAFLTRPFLTRTILVRPFAARPALRTTVRAALGLRCLLGTGGRCICGNDGCIDRRHDGE